MTLQRFVDAQDQEGTGSYATAVAELRAGRKVEHWIWWVFPQLAGLTENPSERTRTYAVRDLAEARAYLAHPVLGPRLLECTALLTAQADADRLTVLGSSTDVAKLRSSMTLFALADPDQPLFRQVLDQWYRGIQDRGTLRLLAPRP